MRLNTSITLVDGVYHVSVDLADTNGFTPVEQEAVTQFGEPTIACGGSFDDGGGLTYTLDTNDKLFPSQFPVKEKFSTVDYPSNANARAVLWRDTIKTRIDAAITTLRSKTVGTVGEEIANIDTSD